MSQTTKPKLVVIGNGMAAMKTVEELLESDPHRYDITVFGAEPYGNYNRILLSNVLTGETNIDDIMLHDKAWYKRHNITLHCGDHKKVVHIDRKNKHVTSQDNTQATFDTLLIATGSNPFIAPIKGNDLDGVIAFRDITDVETMINYSQNKQHAVVLGGGLLGLEAANGLTQKGMQVTVIHKSGSILNRQLDTHAAQLLQTELEKRGVVFLVSTQVEEIQGENGHVTQLALDNQHTIPCDLFIMAIGVKPNIGLAKEAGLASNRGIIVNDTLQTYDPSIYAVGECIEHRGDTFGLVAPLFDQAKVCANHLAHHGVGAYRTLPQATKLKITGIFVFSAGQFNGTPNSESLTFEDTNTGAYKKCVVENNTLIGVVLYGDTQDGLWYQQLIENKISINAIRPLLAFGKAYCQPLLDEINNSTQPHQQNDLATEIPAWA